MDIIHNYKPNILENLVINQKIIRYAWGNSNLKTWFITKHKKVVLPKGSKLLFIIIGEKTDDIIRICDTYPKLGDVIIDTDGTKIKVINVNWI